MRRRRCAHAGADTKQQASTRPVSRLCHFLAATRSVVLRACSNSALRWGIEPENFKPERAWALQKNFFCALEAVKSAFKAALNPTVRSFLLGEEGHTFVIYWSSLLLRAFELEPRVDAPAPLKYFSCWDWPRTRRWSHFRRIALLA